MSKATIQRVKTIDDHDAKCPPPPAYSQTFRPMVIPQTTTTLLNAFLYPFARAYPTDLQSLGMTQAEFLDFLDGVNEAFMLSPVFRILGIAGRITSFTPSLIAMGVGIGVSLASGVAGATMSYVRTKAFVRKWNTTRFHKMGLRVRIVSTKDMMNLVDASSSPSMSPPPTPPTPPIDFNYTTDPRRRRIDALGDKVGELEWTVPEAETPENRWKRMGAWQARKSEAKVNKRAGKIGKKMDKARRKEDEEKQMKLQKKMEKKENKITQRIRWIVIVPFTAQEEEDDDDDNHVDLGLEME